MTETKSRHALLNMLGLCPLLTLSDDWRSGLTLGLATLFIAVSTGIAASLLRSRLAEWSRWPALALLLAIATGMVEIGTRTLAYASWSTTALFLPLLISNCLLLHNADRCTQPISTSAALRRVLFSGTAMAIVLIAAGALRTGLPTDTLGGAALIITGLLLAAKNRWLRGADKEAEDNNTMPPPSTDTRRVRVTGPVR